MTLIGALLVAAGAALGAPVRYLVTRVAARRSLAAIPVATLIVNVAGSALVGVIAGLGSSAMVLAVGTGFCGALTTFSGFSVEVAELGSHHRRLHALAIAGLSLVLCVGAAALGLLLGHLVASAIA